VKAKSRLLSHDKRRRHLTRTGSKEYNGRDDQRQRDQIPPIRGPQMPEPAARDFSMLLHGRADDFVSKISIALPAPSPP
jgi:hypothetical protein